MDIRLEVGVEDSPKVQKLIRRCGEQSYRCLTRLWGQVRVKFPITGIMENWTEEDIEIAAGWNCETMGWKDAHERQFLTALVEVGLVDKHEGKSGVVYSIHNWTERQGHVLAEEIRRENARQAGIRSGISRLSRRQKTVVKLKTKVRD